MTSFLDVIRPLTDLLKSMSDQARLAVETFTAGTIKFRNHTQDVGKLTSPILFLGKGSDAFIGAVNRNADLSIKAITRLSDFQIACDDARKTMEDMCPPYDSESRYLNNVDEVSDDIFGIPYNTFEFQYFLDAQGYTTSDIGDPRTTVVWRIREDTLPGLSSQLDGLLSTRFSTRSGHTLLEDNIDYAVSRIQGDFEHYKSKRHTFLDDALQNKEITKELHTYYSSVVDSKCTMAMGVVNAIAKNMKDGYDYWDDEFIAAANNFIAKVGDVDTGNLAQFQLYNQIDSEFHDPRTRAVFYAMLKSPYGAKFVQYMLNVADCEKMHPCGDALVVWKDDLNPIVGASNDGTVITMKMQQFDPNDLADLGGELAHEAVETYYWRAYRIAGDTLPMDYLADYVRKIVTNQIEGRLDVGSYSYPTYQDWVKDPTNRYVKDFHYDGSPGGNPNLVEELDHLRWSIRNSPNPNFAGNPMGLDPSLLQNDSTYPGWHIAKYWDANTNSFHQPP